MRDGPTTITFTFTDPASEVVSAITTMAFQFGTVAMQSPRQEVRRTRGGTIYVYEKGPKYRTLDLSFENFTYEDRASFEKFFESDLVSRALRWFKVSFKPTFLEVPPPGSVVDGDVLEPSTDLLPGERILVDEITYTVRLLTPDFDFEEVDDGRFNLTMSLEIIDGFLPDNS